MRKTLGVPKLFGLLFFNAFRLNAICLILYGKEKKTSVDVHLWFKIKKAAYAASIN